MCAGADQSKRLAIDPMGVELTCCRSYLLRGSRRLLLSYLNGFFGPDTNELIALIGGHVS